MKKQQRNSIIALISIVLILSLLFFGRTQLITHTYETSKDITSDLKVSTCNNFICELFKIQPVKQTVLFSEAEKTAGILPKMYFKAGESIPLFISADCPDYSHAKNDMKIRTYLYEEGQAVPTSPTYVNTISNVNTNQRYYATRTISSMVSGTFKIYNDVVCYLPGTTTQTASQSYSGLTRTFNVAKPETSCQEDRDTGNREGLSVSSYPGANNIMCEVWFKYTLSSGECKVSTYNKNCQTTCKSNYFCADGVSTTCSGATSCQIKACPIGTTGTYPNCISIIIPDIDPDINPENETIYPPIVPPSSAGYSLIDNKCEKVTESAQYGTLEECAKNIESNYGLLLIILGGTLIVVLIIVLIIKIVNK